ncbi:DUF2459 domain-containing protein [Neisseria weixii]|uniref:DUF2459 domain-containing protein n=1 Tax=Neisseria weixii TaxID=1853276 RepID=A0A3N4N7G7_9NEIS|nr:hypothetical protein CGZ65_04590 [Neisseria weixii]RPD89516.1 DUF2459 domain-containing protein [Neisseria weixii]RPD89853.1 DUF2459 domain-containing protein [Neisseria weixii]
MEAEQHNNQNNEIIISSDGWHSDILVPIKNYVYDWNGFLEYKSYCQNYSLDSYLSIGWGDYRHRLISRPSLWHETSFLNVKILSIGEVEERKDLIRLKINRWQYIQLVNNIQKDFKDVCALGHARVI